MRAVVAATLMSVAACAAPADGPKDVLLTADRGIDGLGEPISPAQVLIRGDRIVAVGSAVNAAGDVEVIDLGDVTLLPGLIDSHVHITYAFAGEPRDTETGIVGASSAEALLLAGLPRSEHSAVPTSPMCSSETASMPESSPVRDCSFPARA